MSKPKNERYHETIRRTLIHRAGSTPDAGTVAHTTLSILQQMTTQLLPVIGARGVDALYRRSLHLARTFLPWVVQAKDEDSIVLFASLKAGLAGLETNAAIEASQALLMTFTKLLTSLIGKSLAKRLLVPVWAPFSPASVQETTASTAKQRYLDSLPPRDSMQSWAEGGRSFHSTTL